MLLDGENIKNLKLEWLRSQIGLVTQEPALLSLSIRENIAYGRSCTFEEIEEAAKTAHAHAFISSLEKGYETQVRTLLCFFFKSYINRKGNKMIHNAMASLFHVYLITNIVIISQKNMLLF